MNDNKCFNYLSGLSFFDIKELNNKLSDILNFMEIPFNENNVMVYVTVSGNYRFLLIEEDFSSIYSIDNDKKKEIKQYIESLGFKMSFFNEDVLKIQMRDFGDSSYFIENKFYDSGFQGLLNSRSDLIHKVCLVLTDIM